YEEEASGKQLCENLDLLEEKCVEAHLRTFAYRRVIARLYNCKVHPRQVGPSDLVLRKVESTTQPDPEANWHQTERVPTESSRSSKKELTPSQG
ncbi:hypothetical protein B296_00004250, partial [Ensete ventricosum]